MNGFMVFLTRSASLRSPLDRCLAFWAAKKTMKKSDRVHGKMDEDGKKAHEPAKRPADQGFKSTRKSS